MNEIPIGKRRRDVGKLAFGGLRASLAVVFSVLGCGFLLLPGLAEDLARAGIGPGLRMILGALHVFGGLALLVPGLAREAVLALALVVTGSAFYFHAEGVNITAAGPASLVLALLVFGACSRFRQRLHQSAWLEMLGRYADQQDSLRSENP